MTTAPVLSYHPLVILRKGDITPTWCRVHMGLTDHLFDPSAKTPLTCLECHPELDPRKEAEDG